MSEPTKYDRMLTRMTKEIQRLQTEQATIQGEIKQVGHQLEELGIVPGEIDIPTWLTDKEAEAKKMRDALDNLFDEIQEGLDEFSN